ncbi:flagellin [Halarcobacter mediterraneus]|uniref:Flagellin n=1 Tax=Halarcobacter mediterraneus TaxID=2023153 RepID=A0A4Q1AYU6_9BACT|nr:flagellin [Halarcobacter mediterraneus]RXK13590.1 flagellin [Halarcobacter mediterraneus]
MRINTNISSLTAQESAVNTNNNIKGSLEKLSSGLKINKASDDASGLAIADKLRTQATSINQGIDNGNSAVALLQIADKSMAEQSNILDTIKAKLIQANTSTTSYDGREAIRKDIGKLLEQLDSIAKQTNYNGNTLLQSTNSTNSSEALTFQIGEGYKDVISSESIKSNTIGLGGGSEKLIQTSGASNQNNIIADNSALIINTNKGADWAGGTDGDGKIDSADIADITITGQTTGATPTNTGIGVINISAEQIDKISDGANDLEVQFDDKTSILIRDRINAGESGFAATDITYDKDKNTFTIIEGGAFSMKDLGKIGSMQVDAGTAEELNITGEVKNLVIHNTEDIKLNGDASSTATTNNQLKVTTTDAAASGALIGGQALASLGNLSTGELTTEKAAQFQGVIDSAISTLNSYRADIGSTQNQVESAVRNLMTQATNVKAAESIIRDVDYAKESANFNKQNIISQAGSYAISQANNVQQNVLRLLQ